MSSDGRKSLRIKHAEYSEYTGDTHADHADTTTVTAHEQQLQAQQSLSAAKGEYSATPAAAPVPEIFPGLELEATAFTRNQLIHPLAPQVALAGRSNVGKSSLVNAIAGRKALAKVSATPGKTRSINYYRVRGTETFLVDLPGYGYAKCSHAEREKWGQLLQYYCANTPGLRALVLLLDARLPPQTLDKELASYAAGLGLALVGVLTKSDKCSKRELSGVFRAWEALLGKQSLMVTSSRTKEGLDLLTLRITALLNAC